MLVYFRRSVIMALIWLVLLGFVYALVGTGVAQAFFKYQADGSITSHGSGSVLIGQNWTSPRWFHGRPDDFGPYAANAKKDISGGDNPLVANGISGESAATNLGQHEDTRSLVALARGRSDARPRHYLRQWIRPRHHAC
jgi:potassium-transporting ATPase KdpC subunit